MTTRFIAACEFVLLFPAALFMTALAVREVPYEPAHAAQQLVMWYAGRMWTLWVLLLALPLTVLVTGGVTLLRNWSRDAAPLPTAWPSIAMMRAHLATLFVAAETLAAGGILAIVVLHMLAN